MAGATGEAMPKRHPHTASARKSIAPHIGNGPIITHNARYSDWFESNPFYSLFSCIHDCIMSCNINHVYLQVVCLCAANCAAFEFE